MEHMSSIGRREKAASSEFAAGARNAHNTAGAVGNISRPSRRRTETPQPAIFALPEKIRRE